MTTCLADQGDFGVGQGFGICRTCCVSVCTETCVCLWLRGNSCGVGAGAGMSTCDNVYLDGSEQLECWVGLGIQVWGWTWDTSVGLELGYKCGVGLGIQVWGWTWDTSVGLDLGYKCGVGLGIQVWGCTWDTSVGLDLGYKCGVGLGIQVWGWTWDTSVGLAVSARFVGFGVSTVVTQLVIEVL